MVTSPHTSDVKFGTKIGSYQPPKKLLFRTDFSTFWLMYLYCICESPGFVPFVANLTTLEPILTSLTDHKARAEVKADHSTVVLHNKVLTTCHSPTPPPTAPSNVPDLTRHQYSSVVCITRLPVSILRNYMG